MGTNVNKYKMNNQPLVSFIMTAKNTERFIDEAIESVLKQTYTNIELVVVDDASTDRTTEIIKSWAKKDARIKTIFNTKSVLPPEARNMAASISHGKYLAILDSDDISLPERATKQVEFMESHPEIGAAGSHAEIIDVEGKYIITKKKNCDISTIRFASLLQCQFIHSSVIIRKELFQKLGGYRPEYMHAEDYDLYTRILQNCDMTNIDEVLIKFRANSGGVTSTNDSSKIQIENSLKITRENISPYVSLSPEKTKWLTDTLNNKKMSLPKVLYSLFVYKKITTSYIKKNNLEKDELENIKIIYRNKQRNVLTYYVKRILNR